MLFIFPSNSLIDENLLVDCCCTNVCLFGCTTREERYSYPGPKTFFFWRSIVCDIVCMSFMCEHKFLWQIGGADDIACKNSVASWHGSSSKYITIQERNELNIQMPRNAVA